MEGTEPLQASHGALCFPPGLQIEIHKDPSFTVSYKWLREEQAGKRVTRMNSGVDSEGKEVHVSPTREAIPRRNDG